MRIAAFFENIEQISKESNESLINVLKRYKSEGLDSVYANFESITGMGIDSSKAMLDEAGLSLEGLWSNIAFGSMSDEEAENAYKAVIDCAKAFDAKHILITPAFVLEEGTKITRGDVKNREDEIVKIIKDMRKAIAYGLSQGVTVTMEDYDWFNSPILFPEVLRRIFDEIPELKCAFDTGNFIPDDKDVMEEFDYYKNRIFTLHLKDRMLENDQNGTEKDPYVTFSGKKYYAASVGSGDMHVKEILDYMIGKGYNGAGIIELFMSTDLENKLSSSIRWIKDNY